jgi:hypothetical protein
MTQHQLIIKRLKKGWTSPLDALKTCGTMKLATRIGELRLIGWVIIDRWAEQNGKRFKQYRM